MHTRRAEKSFDFDEILYTAADFELDERHVSKNEKVALYRLRHPTEFDRTFFMACHILYGWPYCNDAKEGVGAITPPKLNPG